MKGAEGIILSADNHTKLWIGVTMMGAGATVEIHADMVEPLADEPHKKNAAGHIEYHVEGKLVHRRQTKNNGNLPE